MDDKIIAGVASGVADFFGLDVTLVRVVWAIAVLFGGFGLVVYLVLWIVVPERGRDRAVADDFRDATTKSDPSVTQEGSASEGETSDGDSADDESGAVE